MDDALAFLIGLVVGIALGAVLVTSLRQGHQQPGNVGIVFERDERGRITSIHYVPRG